MHILIVEDTEALASTLRTGLEDSGHTVVVAYDGPNGFDHALTGVFDVIVLDMMLPGLDGLEVIRRLRRAKNRVPILALTARDTTADIVRALDLGADDYLTKPFALNEFFARVRSVARKGPSVVEVQLQVGDLVLDPVSGRVHKNNLPLSLTRTEQSLLELFMRRSGQVLRRETILARVWSDNPDVEENTLEVFVRSLRTKIDTGRQASLITTIRGVGYRMEQA